MASIPVPGTTRPGERLGAIPGTVPSLLGELSGCAFRDRCAHAAAACAAPVVPQRTGGHEWRCVLEHAAVA
jgi:peptide/nickel transport system ATP-binding protein